MLESLTAVLEGELLGTLHSQYVQGQQAMAPVEPVEIDFQRGFTLLEEAFRLTYGEDAVYQNPDVEGEDDDCALNELYDEYYNREDEGELVGVG